MDETLTLKQIHQDAESARWGEKLPPEHSVRLADYARERAAREACEAARVLRDADLLCLIQEPYISGGGWTATYILMDGTLIKGYGQSPTEAYLALADALTR